MWAFVYGRRKNLPKPLKVMPGYGDVWLWSTICDDTKIVPAYCFAPHDADGAARLMCDLASRMANRIEFNSDGTTLYESSVPVAFKGEIDYAKIVKVYATPNGKWNAYENRYSQPNVVAVRREAVCGSPTVKEASTSFVERLNLTTRMHNKKMARLTNGHAKKLEMLEHSTAIQFHFYNWVRTHSALPKGTTPAMAAGIATEPQTWETVLNLVDEQT
jgi:IS1 family transposase